MKQELELIGCPWCGKCPTINHMKDIIYSVKCSNFARMSPQKELKYTIEINLKKEIKNK